MTSGGPSDTPDLTGVPVAQLLAEITSDHTTATEAGRVQGDTLKAMGRKVAEVYQRGGITWRQIAEQTSVSVRTVRRYAEPYL